MPRCASAEGHPESVRGRPGIGVQLGLDESLDIGPNGNIYVGSFGGVVSRLDLDIGTKELVEGDRSVSLGYGAWALEVGDVDGIPGDEVVVGTHGHLYVLDAANLSTVKASAGLAWEHRQPRRIAIADIFPNDTGNEIVLVTLQGHLVVFDESLTILSDYAEPGIVDLVVTGEQKVGAATESEALITLLSVRGHVFNVTLDDNADPLTHQPRLQSASVAQLGGMVDHEKSPPPAPSTTQVRSRSSSHYVGAAACGTTLVSWS